MKFELTQKQAQRFAPQYFKRVEGKLEFIATSQPPILEDFCNQYLIRPVKYDPHCLCPLVKQTYGGRCHPEYDRNGFVLCNNWIKSDIYFLDHSVAFKPLSWNPVPDRFKQRIVCVVGQPYWHTGSPEQDSHVEKLFKNLKTLGLLPIWKPGPGDSWWNPGGDGYVFCARLEIWNPDYYRFICDRNFWRKNNVTPNDTAA